MKVSTFRLLIFVGLFIGIVALLVVLAFAKPISSVLVTNIGFIPSKVHGQDYPLELIDPSGRSMMLTKAPQRIISATLATDEILYALVPPDRIIAITDIVDDPGISNIAGLYPKTVIRLKPSIEPILSLEPDLVLTASYTHADTVKLMMAASIPLVRFTQFNSYAHIRQNILTLAKLTGSQKKGQELVNIMASETEYIRQLVNGLKKPRVLYLTESGYTTGPGSILDEAISLAGGYNVIHETNINGDSKITEEFAMGLEPDLIILSGWSATGNHSPAQTLLSNPVWRHVAAVKNRRVYDVHGAWLTSASHYQLRGLWTLAKLFHPGVIDRDCKI